MEDDGLRVQFKQTSARQEINEMKRVAQTRNWLACGIKFMAWIAKTWGKLSGGALGIDFAKNQRLNQLLLFLARHWFFFLVQCSASVWVGWWLRYLPPPGYGIGLLAVLAAAMSLHVEMRNWQKAVWMLLIGACLFLEFRAIEHDRTENNSANTKARNEENEKFDQIAQSMKRSIANNQEQFNATMTRTNRILDNVTGGTSYAVLLPDTFGQDKELPLMIENHGENVLTGVSVMVTFWGAYAGKVPDFILNAVNNRINVGTLGPEERLWLDGKLRTDALATVDQDGEKVLCAYVSITAQNFTSREFLYFKKQDGKWMFKYSIFRTETKRETKIIVQTKGKIVPNTKLEEIEWTDSLNNLKRIR